METKKIFNFKTRFDLPLYNLILEISKKSNRPVYKIIQKALKVLINDYKNGYFDFDKDSRFLNRTENIKKEYYAGLDYELKEKLRRLAFTFKKSQAEILRLALEYFVYVVYKDSEENFCLYYKEKYRHTKRKTAIKIIIYELFSTKTKKILISNKSKTYY